MRISEQARLHKTILILCIVLQAAAALIFSLTLRYELKTSGYDGMAYAQSLDNFIHGRGFVTSINPPFVVQPWLGIHFSPILFALAPLYYLFPHIETLLVVGCIAVASAAWPLYLTARHVLADSFQALVIALLYLASPFVFNGAIWDFHEIDFAAPVMAWMLWAVVARKRYTLLALCALLLTIKEHYGLSVAGFGALWTLHWRERKPGLWLAAAGLAVLVFLCFVVIPHLNPLGTQFMMNAASPMDRFSWLTSLDGIRTHLLPTTLTGSLYLLQLLLPFLLLPLAAPAWLLPGIADLTANMLAQTPMMRSPLSYHSAALMPVILVALCMAVRKLFHGRTRLTANDALLPVIVAALSYGYLQLALPFSEPGNVWEFSRPRLSYSESDARALAAVNAVIPADAPVSAQDNILPNLTPRFAMYPFPEGLDKAEYVLLHLHFPYRRSVTIFGTPYGMTGARFFAKVESMLDDAGWAVAVEDGPWVVLQRHGADNKQARKEARDALAKARDEYAGAYGLVTGRAP